MHDKVPVRLAGVELDTSRHVCAFFNSQDEHYKVLLPFIRDGFSAGDKAFHIGDPGMRQDHLRRLAVAGIDVDTAQATGQLEVRPWEEIYLREGCFYQNAMLALIQEVLRSGKAQNYRLTRFVANMEWALQDCPGVNDIVEYESRLNYVLPQYDDVVICTYDCATFSADIVMDVLRTHPLAIIGGTLQKNPFYVPPEEFLLELRSRAGQAVQPNGSSIR